MSLTKYNFKSLKLTICDGGYYRWVCANGCKGLSNKLFEPDTPIGDIHLDYLDHVGQEHTDELRVNNVWGIGP